MSTIKTTNLQHPSASSPNLTLAADGSIAGGAGLGKVLQVVRATTASNFSTTSTSLVDVTGMSVSITPTLASSVIYVFSSFTHSQDAGSSNTRAYFNLSDGSNTSLSGAETVQSGISVQTYWGNPVTLIGFASPASTSSQTYKLRVRTANSSSTTSINNSSQTGQMIAIEIAA